MYTISTPPCEELEMLWWMVREFFKINPDIEEVIGTFNFATMVLNIDNIDIIYSVYDETERKRLEEVERRREEEKKKLQTFVETYELLYGGVQFKDEDAKNLFFFFNLLCFRK